MDRNQKIAIYSLSGMAILAGTYFYFSTRSTNEQRYQQLLQKFSKEFFSCSKIKLSTMKLKFDQLFNLSIQKQNPYYINIIEKLSSTKGNLEFVGSCNKVLTKGSSYYECNDCSPIIQDLINQGKESQNGQVYLSICEDCFDIQKHKGHKVKKHQVNVNIEMHCYCGDPHLMKQGYFCSHHQGYDQTRLSHDSNQNEQEYLWKGIEQFFLDQFYIIFNKLSDLMNDQMNEKLSDVEQEEIQGRINILLEKIGDKINEITELNPNYIHYFPGLLKKNLQYPISIYIRENEDLSSKWERCFYDQKIVNKDLTILEYMLIFYEYYSDNTDNLLSKLFRTLLKVDDTFSVFFCSNFYKYIEFTFRQQFTEDENSTMIKIVLPSFTAIVTKYICLSNVFENMVNLLNSNIFIPIAVFTLFLKNSGGKNKAEFERVIYQLTTISLEMYRFQGQVIYLLQKYPEESISYLYQLSFTLFTINSIMAPCEISEYKRDNLKRIVNNLFNTLYFRELDKQLISAYDNICNALVVNQNNYLLSYFIQLFTQTYFKYVQEAITFIGFLNSKNIAFKSFSMSFITHLPLLIALSERQMFSIEIVQKFFNKYFEFEVVENSISKQKKEIDKNKLFRDLFTILDRSFQMHSDPYIKQQISYYISQEGESNDSFDILIKNHFGLVEEFLYSPQYRAYDFYILTYSLLMLADSSPITDQQLNFFNLQFQHFQKFQINQPNPIIIFANYDCSDLALQIIFDSTPFFNVFAYTYQLYFPQITSNQDNIEQQQIKANMKEIIITAIQEQNQQKVFLKDVQEICLKSLNNISLINEYINEVCVREQNKQITENDEISLLPEFKEKCYARHLSRRNRSHIDQLITRLQNKFTNSPEKLKTLGSDFTLLDLFTYQQQLCKKVYLNIGYQQKLKEHHFIKKVATFPAAILYRHVYVTLNLLNLKNKNEILTKDELNNTELISKLYSDKKIIQIYDENELYGYLQLTKDRDLVRSYQYIRDQIDILIQQ